MKKIILGTLVIAMPFLANANTDQNLKGAPEGSGACRQISWHKTSPIIIYTALYRHVHITLPDDLVMEPINPNALFDVVGQGKHLFISPTSEDKLAQTTTISALTSDGSSYDFVVHQNEKKHVSCVNITNHKLVSDKQLSDLKKVSSNRNNGGVSQHSQNLEINSLKRRLRMTVAKAEQDKIAAVKEAVRKYRHHIYTRYNWNSSSNKNSFLDTNIINDIYDDGRFTYLRLSNDNKGVPSIEAIIAGEPALIESKYDEVADLYRVVGIYPSLNLIYGDDKIKVTRLDKETKGEF
jgi:hypothetical protein